MCPDRLALINDCVLRGLVGVGLDGRTRAKLMHCVPESGSGPGYCRVM